MKKNNFQDLHKTIIQKGFCTRCGTCVGICPQGAIQFNFDLEEPFLKGHCIPCEICYETCPGKDIPLPKLERRFLGKTRDQRNELLGVSKDFLKGFAKDPEIRQRSASGGLTTALLLFALDRRMIDAAIVTVMDPQKPWRVKPALARTREELIEAAKSKYTLSPNNIML